MGSGAITSLIVNFDNREALYREKINTLNWIARDYKLDIDLFNRLAKNIRYDSQKIKKDNHIFLEELPSKLRLEMAMVIHHSMYQNVEFFSDKDRNYIIWISGVIRPINIGDQEYIYKEGEEVIESKFYLILSI
jgi:hypothetical protein